MIPTLVPEEGELSGYDPADSADQALYPEPLVARIVEGCEGSGSAYCYETRPPWGFAHTGAKLAEPFSQLVPSHINEHR